MKKLIAAIACLIALTGQAYPQASGASLQSQINTSWPDNTSQLITPLALRTVVTDIVKSILTNSGCPSELLGFAADGITPQCYSASVFPSSQTSTVIGNFSGSTQIASSQNVPFCASDGAHALTNPGGSGFNCMGISGAVSNGLAWISPLSYNAAGIIQTTTGTITAASNSLALGSATGWANGAGIWVLGAGSGTPDLVTTISNLVGNTATLAANAGTSVLNAVVGPTGAITSGHNSLTISNPTGWASGEGIDVKGAGASGGDLITTVSVVSGSTFTLGNNAATTVTSAIINHDDTAALSSTITAALAGNLPVYLPAGNYNVTSAMATVTTPISLFGDGRYVTTIWNRSATAQIFTYDYACTPGPTRLQEYNCGSMIRDFSINQASDVTPTAGGAFLFESPNPANDILNGLSMRNMFFYELYNALNIQSTLDTNTFEDIVIDNQVTSYSGSGAYGIIYNNCSPGGDNWVHNVNLTNAGMELECADATTFSNVKITGGSGPSGDGLLFNPSLAANVTDVRFVNFYIENISAGGACPIDFGSGGLGGAQFVGGGLGAVNNGICNLSAVNGVPPLVQFVGFNWGPGGGSKQNFQTSVQGSTSVASIAAYGDQTSALFSGTANNGVTFSDPGSGVDLFQFNAPSTNAFNHFLWAGWNSGGHRVGALDAAGTNFDHSIAQNWPCASTCTAGNIEILTTSGQIADATTATTDGGVGILLGVSQNIAGDGTQAVAAVGQATCNFDAGSTTPGDFVSYSTTTPGDCHDAGASRPSHGIGRVRFNSIVNVLPF